MNHVGEVTLVILPGVSVRGFASETQELVYRTRCWNAKRMDTLPGKNSEYSVFASQSVTLFLSLSNETSSDRKF
jgi:hypothetical protein